MHKLKLLVTGGAGYIGSHMVRTLGEGGHEIIVYDNLSSGFADAVLFGKLIVDDLADRERLELLFKAERFDAVLHFAAHIVVPESVRDPIKYSRNNFANALNLVDACVRHGVKNFIFSSTAAVYGAPAKVPIGERSALEPVNPYGSSKLMVERMLRDVSLAADFSYVALRYFNAAGADQKARIGERHDPETHLIPLAVKAALDRHLRQGLHPYRRPYRRTRPGTRSPHVRKRKRRFQLRIRPRRQREGGPRYGQKGDRN
jgi:UDP-glucose 4-epimerase